MNSEKVFKGFLFLNAIMVLVISAGILLTLISGSIPSIKEFGLDFIWTNNWDPTVGQEKYGALPFIFGTIYTSILAIIITFPFAFSISLFLGEYYTKGMTSSIIRSLVDLLAGIPSVVYGLWGFYTLKPILAMIEPETMGYGVMTSSIILAIMIIPFAASLSTEVIKMVPNDLKEAAYSMGATRFEVIWHVILPNASSGIFAGFILALGRALGETMAVTMLIGNANKIPQGLFDMGNTMASLIANQFGEADGIKFNSLVFIGLLLFIITGVVNFIGKYVMKKLSAR